MSAWLFQGNPSKWRRASSMNEYLRTNRRVRWLVSPEGLGRDMRTGDRAFIWRSVGKGREPSGVVAVGNIVGGPEVMPDDVGEPADYPSANTNALRVIIALEDVRLDRTAGMLLRDELKQHPSLQKLTILKMARPTTYELDKQQEAALETEWRALGNTKPRR
jgi:hypothetical protein